MTNAVGESWPDRHPGATGDKAAVIMSGSGVTVTYQQLSERMRRVASALRDCGVAPGDGVAVLMENRPEWFEIVWGARRAGAYLTPVNTHLAREEIDYIIEDCGARVVIASSRYVDPVPPSDARLLIEIGDMASGGTKPYHTWLAEASSAEVLSEVPGSEMIYSSGTTGRPKGIRRPLAPLDAAHPQVTSYRHARQYGVGADSVYLLPAPMYHSAPLIGSINVQILGGTVILMEKFDAADALAAIEQHRVTHGQFVPTMFIRMLRVADRSRYDVSSLRSVVHAAAPCPVPVKRQMLDWWGPIIHEYHNATEGLGGTRIGPEEWMRHPGSVGKAGPNLHILDEEFEEVPPNSTGTIYFENPSAFTYHGDDAKLASMTSPQGFRTVGDMGYVDDDGYLFLTDRSTFMIVSGGVNIYPQEIESLLVQHLAVADVAVFGVPNAEYGEKVKAIIQPLDLEADRRALERSLLEHCRQHLASYKQPRSIEFREGLSRDPNGKLYKRRIRDEYWPSAATRI